MVKTFPPCQALFVDPASCRKIETEPDYNMTAITWTKDSSALVVLAQVPCTSNYGGISCQSMGYEVEVPSGKSLETYLAGRVPEGISEVHGAEVRDSRAAAVRRTSARSMKGKWKERGAPFYAFLWRGAGLANLDSNGPALAQKLG